MTREELITTSRESGLEYYGLGKDRERFIAHITRFAELVCADAFEQGRQEGMKQEKALRALRKLSKLGQEIEAQPDNTAKMYEELRSIIDGGSESFTHEDAVQYLKDNLAPLKWTPEDTAHRPGGLAQPEQEPVAWMYTSKWKGNERFITHFQTDLSTYKADEIWPLFTSPPQRQPLTPERVKGMLAEAGYDKASQQERADFINGIRHAEIEHGIGDKT